MATDLLFNNKPPKAFLTRAFVRMTSGWDGPARSKVWRFLIKDEAAFLAAPKDLDALEIERVISSHGQPIENVTFAVSPTQAPRRRL